MLQKGKKCLLAGKEKKEPNWLTTRSPAGKKKGVSLLKGTSLANQEKTVSLGSKGRENREGFQGEQKIHKGARQGALEERGGRELTPFRGVRVFREKKGSGKQRSQAAEEPKTPSTKGIEGRRTWLEGATGGRSI